MTIEDWPEHWHQVTDDKEHLLKAELEKEVSEGHPLWSKPCLVIARRDDKDDILVETRGNELPYAEVHLTWSSVRETDPRWPTVSFFSSMTEWRTAQEQQS